MSIATTAATGSERAAVASAAAFQLRFESLFHAGRGLAFPCDASGCV